MAEVNARVLGRTVTVEARLLGDDVHVLVYGGDAAHVGGTALAVPYLSAGSRPSASLSSLAAPGHKDEVLWRALAKRIAVEFDACALVSGGVHFDSLAADDLASVSEQLEDLVMGCVRELAANTSPICR